MGECHTFIWRKWLGEYAGVFPTYFHNAFWQLNFLKARKENNFGFLLKGVVQDHKPCVIEFTIIVSDFHVLWAMAVLLLVCGLMVPRRPCPLGSTRALHYPFFRYQKVPCRQRGLSSGFSGHWWPICSQGWATQGTGGQFSPRPPGLVGCMWVDFLTPMRSLFA